MNSLFAFEVRWAETVGRALLPPGLLGGIVDGTALGDAFLAEHQRSPWFAALLMRLSLWLTWLAPLWLERRPRTFGGLDPDAREALLERLLLVPSYNLRLAAMFLKLTMCTLLLGDRRVLGRLGAYRLDEPTHSHLPVQK